jgi:alpha-D-xyloside xylohydrolase
MQTNKVYLGNGARYTNLYPLLANMAVSEGQRAASDQKRVFILSRSAYAGSQRYGVTAWSGDVLSDFETYKRQIPAGLNYSLSGMPYWTTDIGGFFIGHPNSPEYRELFIRWFQYGAFCPIFRVHGTRVPSENELWSYGSDAESILTDFDRLRYRLMPYIYSLAWKVTSQNGTLMRPLVMDYRSDVTAQNIGDQFLFGPSILVNPVTAQGSRSRELYLPQGQWYDFWTGAKQDGGKRITAPAPLNRIPLFVRAGSIVPFGPELEYTTEKAADPIELRVYRGADADFTIYEDENDTYNYEKGAYATIPLHWNDSAKQLTIGERAGEFLGMLKERNFRVVFVGDGRGVGIPAVIDPGRPDATVHYDGHAVVVAGE